MSLSGGAGLPVLFVVTKLDDGSGWTAVVMLLFPSGFAVPIWKSPTGRPLTSLDEAQGTAMVAFSDWLFALSSGLEAWALKEQEQRQPTPPPLDGLAAIQARSSQ